MSMYDARRGEGQGDGLFSQPPIGNRQSPIGNTIALRGQTKVEKEFANRVVLVTGATSGIGKATALAFAEAGADVVTVGRSVEALSKFSEQLAAYPGRRLALSADLSIEADVDRIVTQTVET